jgi:hypothetical protein
MESRSVPELRRKLADMERQLELSEARNKEKEQIMQEFLLSVGIRETCTYCEQPVVWARIRSGLAIMFNLDGTEHWPRCPKAQRPKATAMGE